MKTETITQRILTADEGMYLTDGQTYGTTVVLPADADYSAWYEITEADLPDNAEICGGNNEPEQEVM